MDLKEVNAISSDINNHWYYSSKAKAIYSLLDGMNVRSFADIGSGSAFFSKFLLAHGLGSEAWCIDINYQADLDEIENTHPIHYRRSIGSMNVDLVILMDVMEHVDDDIGLLREYIDKCPIGTIFLITVPAFNVLWSKHDEFLGHKRRYSLSQLEEVVLKAGLTIDKTMYFFMLVLPFSIIYRVIQHFYRNSSSQKSQLVEHNKFVNIFFKFICSIELTFMKLNKLMGLTVVCLAKK